MKLKLMLTMAVLFSFLGGCVTTPQMPIKVEQGFWDSNDKKIGVVMTAIPKPNVFLPGASCLLCVAVAEAANASLSKHIDTISIDDLASLKTEVAERLKEKGSQTVILEEDIDLQALPNFRSKLENTAKKDFSKYQNDNALTHLAVIQLGVIGMKRTYANYVPTSDPKGIFTGQIYLIDLTNNTYESYESFEIIKAGGANWKEPPSYPALTNAFYQALETGKDIITNSVVR